MRLRISQLRSLWGGGVQTWAVVLLLTAAARCAPLPVQPGSDFAVGFADSSATLSLGQMAGPVQVAVEARGCADLELRLGSTWKRGLLSEPLTVTSDADGHATASLPIPWLLDGGVSCANDVTSPLLGGIWLRALCRSDGRVVTSATKSIEWITASRRVPIQTRRLAYLFPLEGSARWLAWGDGLLASYDEARTQGTVDAVSSMYLTMTAKPRYGRLQDVVLLWAGCPVRDCRDQGDHPADQIYIDLATARTGTLADALHVFNGGNRWVSVGAPIEFVDVAYPGTSGPWVGINVVYLHGDGTLEWASPSVQGGYASLGITSTKLPAGTVGLDLVETRGRTQADGTALPSVCVLSVDSAAGSLSLRSADKSCGWSTALPGQGAVVWGMASPDLQHWALLRGTEVWVGNGQAWSAKVDTSAIDADDSASLPPSTLQTAWSGSGQLLVLASKTTALIQSADPDTTGNEAGTAKAPIVYRPAVAPNPDVQIVGVAASEHAVALTTARGVRVLDLTGHEIAGINEGLRCLPRRSSEAVFLDSDTVAVAFDDAVYWLQLTSSALGDTP